MKTKLFDLLVFSEKRKHFMILLRDGPKNFAEIRQSLNVTSSGVIPQIRMLEQRGLVYQNEKGYALTDTGLLLSNYLGPFVNAVDIIEQHENYWNTHDLGAIPEHLLARIHELVNCRVDEVDLDVIYEPHRLFYEMLSESEWIKGATPVYNPAYPDFLLNLAKLGKRISLILAPEVLTRAKKENMGQIEKFMSFDTEMYVFNGEMKLASVVSDRYFSLTTFFKNGGYDPQKNLISTDHSSILWGEELYEYLLNYSTKIF